MKIKNIFLAAALLCTTLVVSAQESRKDVIFRAMSDEMARTKSIKMGNMPSPFFVEYYLEDVSSMSITSQYGSVVSYRYTPAESRVGGNILLGDYKNNSTLNYGGAIGTMSSTIDNNYNSIRTSFWSLSDAIYKNSLKEFGVKFNVLSQVKLSDEEKEIADLIKYPTVTSIASGEKVVYDSEKWKAICNKLSAVFSNYPDLYNTSVSYTAVSKDFYHATTDGMQILQSASSVIVTATAFVQDDNGAVMNDQMTIFGDTDASLPSEQELLQRVEKFASKMNELKSIPAIDEFYSGPVLLVDGAVMEVMAQAFLNNTFVATKNLTTTGWTFNSIERRIGKKIVDTKISIKNYTNKREYNGKPLVGHYKIDIDGVVPQAEMTLVENGLIKGMLSGSSETPVNKKSTGSARMSLTERNISKQVVPSTLHIQAKDGLKELAMQKELFKLAKEEGLTYAYVIYNASSRAPEIYKVDIKSGEKTRVGSVRISGLDLKSMRRIAAVSKEEIVENIFLGGVAVSIITPKSMILSDIELDFNPSNKQAAPIVKSPLKK